jgi:hypothetical protein
MTFLPSDSQIPQDAGVDSAADLLLAASDLSYFNAEELAKRAGVTVAAAETFIMERAGLIEQLPQPLRSTDGNEMTRTHRLRPEKGDAVAAWLAAQTRSREEPMSDAPSLLEMLESALTAIAAAEYGPEKLQRALAVAHRQWLGARANFWDRQAAGRQLEANEAVRLAAAGDMIARLRDPGHAVREESRAVAAAQWRPEFERHLIDWTLPFHALAPSSQTAKEHDLDDAEALAGLLEYEASRAASPWPAVFRLAAMRDAMPVAALKVMPAVLCARLYAVGLARGPHPFTALALAAAWLNVQSAASPILAGLLGFRGISVLGGEPLRLGYLALARLACPQLGQPPLPSEAAHACQYLLAFHEPDAGSVQLLVPAAFAAEGPARAKSVLKMALHHYQAPQPLISSASLRNLALAMAFDEFNFLRQNLDQLLDVPHGQYLISAIGDHRHSALEFDDIDHPGGSFQVRPVSQVAAMLAGAPPEMRDAIFDLNDGVNKERFAKIIEARRREKPSPIQAAAQDRRLFREQARRAALAEAPL